MTTHTLNRRLAELTGWTNIIELGGALLGTPPAGEPQCRGQAPVPDWAGDWRACGPLMVRLRITLEVDQKIAEDACAYAHVCIRGSWRRFAEVLDGDHNASHDAAARRAVVRAVIAKLEAGQ